MAQFLLEIGTEEIPSGYIEDGLKTLKELTEARLKEARIEMGQGLHTLGTPRRLVLMGRELGARQPDDVKEITGPPVSASFDADGNPTKAAMGFAKKQGVSVEELGRLETPKGEYLYLKKDIPGRSTGEVLSELLPEVIRDIPWPKSMRWGAVGFLFARPIHWITALLDGVVVPFEVADVRSGSSSCGHRFMAPEVFDVRGIDDYLEKIANAKVVVDPEARKDKVSGIVKAAAETVSGEAVLDSDLVDTVAHLVEFPSAVCGGFDESFLSLPDPVIITPMAEHQKYFAVRDKEGRLLPNFVAVNNTIARDDSVVRRGHERVLRARLSDADFFFKEDRKRPLLERLEDLKDVIYQSELGTSYEKVERFTELAAYISDHVAHEKRERVLTAARLAKCDLVTEMVGEFPSLQGTMGEEYARLDGHPGEVSAAVREHYMPIRSGEDLPNGEIGAIVSVADRLDTISGCFAIGQEPTGAADPFALRRHALAILRILENRAWDISLDSLIDRALDGLGHKVSFDAREMRARIASFFMERYRNRMVQKGYDADVVDAVISAGFDRIHRLVSGIEHLGRFVKTSEEFESLVLTFKRVNNILKKQEGLYEVNPSLFQEECERRLWQIYGELREDVLDLIENREDGKALDLLATLRRPVDEFFEGVEVLTKDDQRLRENRVGMLQYISRLFLRVADFSRFSL